MLLGKASFGKSLDLRIRGAKERQMRLATFDTSPSLWHLISQSAAEKYFKIAGIMITLVQSSYR